MGQRNAVALEFLTFFMFGDCMLTCSIPMESNRWTQTEKLSRVDTMIDAVDGGPRELVSVCDSLF